MNYPSLSSKVSSRASFILAFRFFWISNNFTSEQPFHSTKNLQAPLFQKPIFLSLKWHSQTPSAIRLSHFLPAQIFSMQRQIRFLDKRVGSTVHVRRKGRGWVGKYRPHSLWMSRERRQVGSCNLPSRHRLAHWARRVRLPAQIPRLKDGINRYCASLRTFWFVASSLRLFAINASILPILSSDKAFKKASNRNYMEVNERQSPHKQSSVGAFEYPGRLHEAKVRSSQRFANSTSARRAARRPSSCSFVWLQKQPTTSM